MTGGEPFGVLFITELEKLAPATLLRQLNVNAATLSYFELKCFCDATSKCFCEMLAWIMKWKNLELHTLRVCECGKSSQRKVTRFSREAPWNHIKSFQQRERSIWRKKETSALNANSKVLPRKPPTHQSFLLESRCGRVLRYLLERCVRRRSSWSHQIPASKHSNFAKNKIISAKLFNFSCLINAQRTLQSDH